MRRPPHTSGRGAGSGVTVVCVLLVEDEPMIRDIMAESLLDAGFEVHEVSSGEEAVEAIAKRARPYSVLVTDFHMQGKTTGIDVASRIREAYPGLPVVIASGRPDVFDPRWSREHGFKLLRKPYVASDLVALVKELVDIAK